jgi:hypothetical protein
MSTFGGIRLVSALGTPGLFCRGREWGEAKRGECRLELAYAGVASVPFGLEALANHRLESTRGILWPAEPQAGLDERIDLHERLPFEGQVSGDELAEGDSEGPNVGAVVDVARRLHLLGGHVARRADRGPFLRDDRAGAPLARGGGRRHQTWRFRNAEVEDFDGLDHAIALDRKQVRRLEIPVNDPQFVRLRNRIACLQNEVDGDVDLRHAVSTQPGREIAPLQVLHNDVRTSSDPKGDVEHPNHVLALDGRGGSGLADEASHGV